MLTPERSAGASREDEGRVGVKSSRRMDRPPADDWHGCGQAALMLLRVKKK